MVFFNTNLKYMKLKQNEIRKQNRKVITVTILGPTLIVLCLPYYV